MGRVRDWWGSRHVTRIWAGRSLVNRHHGRWAGRKRRLSLWSTGRKDHASSEETKYKLQMAQSITDTTSTDENGKMLWKNSMFCNDLINYAVHENSLNVIFVNWMSYQVGIVNDFPFSSACCTWIYFILNDKFSMSNTQRSYRILAVKGAQNQ